MKKALPTVAMIVGEEKTFKHCPNYLIINIRIFYFIFRAKKTRIPILSTPGVPNLGTQEVAN